MRTYEIRGYGLVVERHLAKVETGFRLPLPAQKSFCLSFGYVLEVDKGVHTGDKGHGTFWSVREIVSV